MSRDHPKGELAPRDVVARSIIDEMHRTDRHEAGTILEQCLQLTDPTRVAYFQQALARTLFDRLAGITQTMHVVDVGQPRFQVAGAVVAHRSR